MICLSSVLHHPSQPNASPELVLLHHNKLASFKCEVAVGLAILYCGRSPLGYLCQGFTTLAVQVSNMTSDCFNSFDSSWDT